MHHHFLFCFPVMALMLENRLLNLRDRAGMAQARSVFAVLLRVRFWSYVLTAGSLPLRCCILVNPGYGNYNRSKHHQPVW